MAGNTVARKRDELAIIEGAEIRFRNFSGEADGPYDVKGKRYFHILLTEAQAAGMEADGINVKYLKPREEGDVPQAHVKVLLKYGVRGRPDPKVILVTLRDGEPIAQTELTEPLLMVADFAEIDYVDAQLRVYDWEMNGRSGKSVALKSLYINMVEDDLTRKYADVPKIGFNGTQQLELEAGQDPDMGELVVIEDDEY